MSKKVFISYSHKDESHREDFEEHLTMMRRNGIIDSWSDRKIIPGEDWKDKIDKNLESANIIVFLVSSSFLASDYCYDVEVKRAIQRHTEGTAQIISIIVRDCDWSDCQFARFQVVPKDALPITKWENKDSAWLDAIKGIKKHIEAFKSKLSVIQNENPLNSVHISEETQSWLEDTEIVLTHRKVDKIKLSDIYVVPDIEIESTNNSGVRNFKSADSIISSTTKYILSGEEQHGKTSLLKKYYMEFLKKGFLPLYVDGLKINESKISDALKPFVESQYANLNIDDYLRQTKKVLLIDNIDDIKLRPTYRDKLLASIKENFEASIFTCHSSFTYVLNEISVLEDYNKAEILFFGNKKREEMIQKWICLGNKETINENEMYTQCDELKDQLNNIIKKNIVPAKPIYILMLLQSFEANSKLNLELTSYGHCYQQLIYKAFENAKISDREFDKYLNVLTELSWWIHINQKNPTMPQLDIFFAEYCKDFLPVDKYQIIENLINHSILVERDYKFGFKYPYILYFFVGKKIADSYSESQESENQVDNLLENLHREDFANILIFITHHTRDSWVLAKINNVLSDLFSDQNPATLEISQLLFMNEFMKNIPQLVIEQREIQSVRDDQNEKLDIEERKSEDVDELQPVDILAQINKTFKGMEIAGQIIRNRHASLKLDPLLNLAKSGVFSGLRFLKYFIEISDAAKNEIIRLISNHLSERPDRSDKEIEKHAEHAYLHLTYGVINAVIRKISTAVGSKEGIEIYRLLEKETPTPATLLIKQSIELHFNKKIDMNSISNCVETFKDNPVCTRILKELVVQHVYMFPVDYKEKQKLSDLLDIPMKGQQLAQQKQKKHGS